MSLAAPDKITSSPSPTNPGVPPKTGLEGWISTPKWWAKWLEWLMITLEKPVNRLSTTPQLNPFYHTGTISLFLLAVVSVSGFYLYIFFQYGYDSSYAAALRLESQPIGQLMRALHRYASGALLITTLLHAIRMLFMERFRGPRRLAWLTGHVMVALMWIAGVSGYLLLWDTRAKFLNDRLLGYLDRWTPWGAGFANWQVNIESGDRSWAFLFMVLVVHVLSTIIIFGFFYLHIQRLPRAKLFPEGHWLIGMATVLIIGSILFPLGILPPAANTALAERFTFDPIFLFFLPNDVGWAIWLGLFMFGLAITFLPWLSKQTPPLPTVKVIDDRCTGCTRCAIDCPYGAIEMIDLPEGSPHKYLAVADPDLCTSCGICIGSCLDDAITLGEFEPADLRTAVRDRIEFAKLRAPSSEPADIEIVFTCQRFANQGARPYLERQVRGVQASHGIVEVIAVPCAGSVPPDLLIHALNEGAAEVRLIGCPPDDCANREGNLIAEQRLTRERPPKLKRAYANVPISAVWLPPNEFDSALAADVNEKETNWLESRRLLDALTWRNFLPAFALLAGVMLIQILTNRASMVPWQPNTAQVEIALTDIEPPYLAGGVESGDEWELILDIDGETEQIRTLSLAGFLERGTQPLFEEIEIDPGAHTLHLYLSDAENNQTITLLRAWPEIEPLGVYRLSNRRLSRHPADIFTLDESR